LATFIPEQYGALGHWVLNARNALDGDRTYARMNAVADKTPP
jgi:hypothetical protein